MISKISSLLLSISLLFLVGCDNGKKEQSVPQQAKELPPLPVEVITVQKENIPIWLEYTGKTEASKRVEIRARVSGRLERVFFKDGEAVEEGQKLFEIEKSTYEAGVDQAKAKLEGDLASLKLAKADVGRYIPLVQEGLAPRVTLEQYEARVQELEAIIKADRSLLREAQLNLSYTDIVAPISGRISRVSVDVGNIVGYGEKTLLTSIIYDNPMYAYFNPSEEKFQIMHKYRSKDNLDARVRVPSKIERLLDRSLYKGFVDFSDNRVDRMTSTISMRAAVANDKHDLLEGTFVYVEVFVTDKVPFLMVPPSIVQEDQLGSFLYVADENNMAKRADITSGFEGREYLMITDGLKDGDRVIISGLAKLRPGAKLAPKDLTETKSVMALIKEKQMVPEKE